MITTGKWFILPHQQEYVAAKAADLLKSVG
jgi:hypothetical protein